MKNNYNSIYDSKEKKIKFRQAIRECSEADKPEMIRKNLKKKLKESRYIHTLGVANTAQALAMSIGYDLKKAYLAGLLHDCAKCISDDEQLKRCKKNKIHITEIETKSPHLLHAKLGAFMAKEKYLVDDADILDAITCHTTGKPAMNDLEMILFVADYIEPGRDKAPNLAQIRQVAFRDLTQAVYLISKDTLNYLKTTGNPIDEMTEKSYNYYRKIYEK